MGKGLFVILTRMMDTPGVVRIIPLFSYTFLIPILSFLLVMGMLTLLVPF